MTDRGARAAASGHLRRACALLMLSYPQPIRAHRSEELIGTLLDLAPPGSRWPRLADAADVVADGLRRRVGRADQAGFAGGLAVAGPLALAFAAGLSAFALWRAEPLLSRPDLFWLPVSWLVYLLWIVGCVCRALLPAGWGLAVLRIALLSTVLAPAVALVAKRLGVLAAAPPLLVTLALVLLAVVAIAAPAPTGWEPRLTQILAGLAAVVGGNLALLWWPVSDSVARYGQTLARLGAVGAAVLAGLLGSGLGIAGRRRAARLWAGALLAAPIGLLGPFSFGAAIGPVATDLGMNVAGQLRFGRLAQASLVLGIAGLAVVWLGRPVPGEAVARQRSSLTAVGAVCLGCALGIGGFLLAAGAPIPVPTAVALAALVAIGLSAIDWSGARWWGVAKGLSVTPAAATAALLVAGYDHDWRSWECGPATAALIANLALVPLLFTLACVAGLPVRGGRGRTVSVICAAALAYLTVPYVGSWGPAPLIVVVAVGAAIFGSGRLEARVSRGYGG